jgi:hypothetical protein
MTSIAANQFDSIAGYSDLRLKAVIAMRELISELVVSIEKQRAEIEQRLVAGASGGSGGAAMEVGDLQVALKRMINTCEVIRANLIALESDSENILSSSLQDA